MKALLVDAICGKGFKDMRFADNMVKLGLAKYTGNQWNESWEWGREELEAGSEEALQSLYEYLNSDE